MSLEFDKHLAKTQLDKLVTKEDAALWVNTHRDLLDRLLSALPPLFILEGGERFKPNVRQQSPFNIIDDAIDEELERQNEKWGKYKQQSIPGYLVILQGLVLEAQDGWRKNLQHRESPLLKVVQVAATAISCLRRYGPYGSAVASDDIRDSGWLVDPQQDYKAKLVNGQLPQKDGRDVTFKEWIEGDYPAVYFEDKAQEQPS